MTDFNFEDISAWQNKENIRLENEGYCKKISDGLSKLDDKQGEIRAIWELIQNARDCANDNGATIKLELNMLLLANNDH